MIFKDSEVCALAYCQEIHAETGIMTMPDAIFSLIFVSSGRVAASANSAPFLLNAGNLLLARGAVTLTPATDVHVLCLGLTGSAAQMIAQNIAEPLLCDAHVCPQAPQLISEIFSAYHSAMPLSAGPLCYALLCTLANADDATARLPKLVADAILAMRQNYNGLYGIEELSAQLGVSKNHLVRVFSAEMGVPPGQYLTKVRLDAVKQLLSHRDYSLEVIATLCGFSGANYLCKVFKKETGQTPTAWRNQNIGTAAPLAPDEVESALFL